jgi:hypothetical protein
MQCDGLEQASHMCNCPIQQNIKQPKTANACLKKYQREFTTKTEQDWLRITKKNRQQECQEVTNAIYGDQHLSTRNSAAHKQLHPNEKYNTSLLRM